MKLVIERDKALAAVARAMGAAQSGGTIPILQHLMLAADRDRLLVYGTDLDVEACGEVVARVSEIGSITVPAATLHGILRGFPPGGEVAMELSAAPARLVVKCGRSRYQLPTLPAGDFPLLVPPERAHRAVVGAPSLRRLLAKTEFAMAGPREVARFYLQGIYVHVVEDGGHMLRFAATDGSRLAVAWAGAPEGLVGAPPVIVGRKAIAELKGLVEGDDDGDVEIAISANLIEFSRGGHRLTSKLIDGTFPQYDRVIPRGGDPRQMRTEAKSIAAALQRAQVTAQLGKSSRSVRMHLGGGLLKITSRDDDGSQGEELLDVEYAGGDVDLGFNARFLLDALNTMSGSAILELRGVADAAKMLDPSDPGCVFVVMPLRA